MGHLLLCVAEANGGWPNSLLSWDILFLLPLPWWGPVLAPVAISLLLIGGSLLVIVLDRSGVDVQPRRLMWLMATGGVMLAMYLFMSDTLAAVAGGMDTIREVLPVAFNWPLFALALVLMAAPVVELGQIALTGRGSLSPNPSP